MNSHRAVSEVKPNLTPWIRFGQFGCYVITMISTFALPANSELLREGQIIRSIPFSLRDEFKPMIEVIVGNKKGVMMFDNGTPDIIFLNRDALNLPQGRYLTRGSAASGQSIEVQVHPTPIIQISGQLLQLPDSIRSGDFSFTASGLGKDFLGFIGTKMVEDKAFLLDYARQKWVVLKVGKDGSLPVSPKNSDVIVSVRFLIWPGQQPTIAASLGKFPVITDFDTGDSGTLYITNESRKKLLEQNLIEPDGELWRLQGLSIGGNIFNSTKVRLVTSGGKEDFRSVGQSDQLRLGSRFLAENTCLWNFPAKTLTFLKPNAPYLVELTKSANNGKVSEIISKSNLN